MSFFLTGSLNGRVRFDLMFSVFFKFHVPGPMEIWQKRKIQSNSMPTWPKGDHDILSMSRFYYTFRLFLCLFFSFLGWLVRQILGSRCSIVWSYALPYSDSVSCSDWSNINHFSFHVFSVQNTVSWTNWINYPDNYSTRIYRNVFG